MQEQVDCPRCGGNKGLSGSIYHYYCCLCKNDRVVPPALSGAYRLIADANGSVDEDEFTEMLAQFGRSR